MNVAELKAQADFWPCRILLTAAELDIFSAVGDGASATAVAEACATDLRATERLLDALTAMEVLIKQDGDYAVAPELRAGLLPGEQCIVPSLLHRATLWRSWSRLTDVVRSGEPAVEPYEDDERPDEQVRSFIGAMAVGARMHAPAIVAALDLGKVRTVLDLGGGPGTFAAEFCRAKPELRAVILDLPRVCEIARANLLQTDFADRVSFVPGEVRTVDSEPVMAASGGGGFDLVFMSSLIHSMSPAQIAVVFERAIGWTAPGGRVVVRDFFLDESRTRPARAAIFAINMLVNTPGGNSYTWSECERWLTEAARRQGIGEPQLGRIMVPETDSTMVQLTLPG